MLAQNFKSATELGLDEKVLMGLHKVLTRLEINDLVYVPDAWGILEKGGTLPPNGFSMNIDLKREDCGTVGCLGGWTSIETGINCETIMGIENLERLFYPNSTEVNINYDDITTGTRAKTNQRGPYQKDQ